MKRITEALMTIALMIGMIVPTTAQIQRAAGKGSDIKLGKGLRLLYEVDFYGRNYDFLLEVRDIDKDGSITFLYTMGRKYDINKGHPTTKVKIAGDALQVATAQSNQFNGQDLSLPYRTTVWISEKVFDALTGTDSVATITPDNKKPEVEIKTTAVGRDYVLEGKDPKDIAYFYAESKDGKIKYWVHHNRDNRLILKMDQGWQIRLKEIDESRMR